MRNTALFVRSKEAEHSSYVTVISRNLCIISDNLIAGEPYRHQLQSYYDGLVTNGIISFIKTDGANTISSYTHAVFKVKGIEALQKVSSNNSSQGMTIEDLFILAANTNNIDYPKSIDPNATTTNYQKATTVGAAILTLYGISINSPLLAPVLTTAVAKEAISFMNDYTAERPKSKL